MNAIARILGLLILDMLVSLGTTGHFSIVATSAAAGATAGAGPADGNNSAQAFERLTSLAGTWEASTPRGKVTTTYELVSGGSVLLERLEMGGKDPMVTTYHLDGRRLVLEHYCHAGNQPLMEAKPFLAAANEIDFDFVSAQNLAGPNAGHMHQLKLRFNSADEVAADWIWSEDGRLGARNVSLVYHRVK
jgi:hypothetical protein